MTRTDLELCAEKGRMVMSALADVAAAEAGLSVGGETVTLDTAQKGRINATLASRLSDYQTAVAALKA